MVVGTATATAVYFEALPPPPRIKIVRTIEVKDEEDQRLEALQRQIEAVAERNRAANEKIARDREAARYHRSRSHREMAFDQITPPQSPKHRNGRGGGRGGAHGGDGDFGEFDGDGDGSEAEHEGEGEGGADEDQRRAWAELSRDSDGASEHDEDGLSPAPSPDRGRNSGGGDHAADLTVTAGAAAEATTAATAAVVPRDGSNDVRGAAVPTVDGGDGSRAMRVNEAPDTTLTSASVYGRFASGALTASHSAFGLGVLW